ncbi:MAG: zinc ribbon domain-containing protein [Pseudomonadota bacterium]
MFYCPHCGEQVVDDDASICPHCGSDDETGWRGDIDYYSTEIPEWESDEVPPLSPVAAAAEVRLSRRGQGFLCAIAVLAGLIMVTLEGRTHPRLVFGSMLVVGGSYGLIVHARQDPKARD